MDFTVISVYKQPHPDTVNRQCKQKIHDKKNYIMSFLTTPKLTLLIRTYLHSFVKSFFLFYQKNFGRLPIKEKAAFYAKKAAFLSVNKDNEIQNFFTRPFF